METRDKALDAEDREVMDVVSVEPIAEASVSDIIGAVPGYVLAQDVLPAESSIYIENAADTAAAEVSEEAFEDAADDMLPHKNGQLTSVLECMLFVANEPMSAKQLAETLEMEEESVQEALNILDIELKGGRGLQLMKLAGGYQLCTKPEFSDYCTMILQPAKKKLSKAALETLAVVAYRQPCTIPEVEAVRGVSVGSVMKTLTERGVVKEAGHKQTPGRPMLYITTQEFLEYFGLNDISELPDIDMLAVEEVKALEAQRELFSAVTISTEADSDTEEAVLSNKE